MDAQQKSLMPDKPFFMYYAPSGDPTLRTRPRAVVGEVQGQIRPGMGRVA